jgi:hypothetical protein
MLNCWWNNILHTFFVNKYYDNIFMTFCLFTLNFRGRVLVSTLIACNVWFTQRGFTRRAALEERILRVWRGPPAPLLVNFVSVFRWRYLESGASHGNNVNYISNLVATDLIWRSFSVQTTGHSLKYIRSYLQDTCTVDVMLYHFCNGSFGKAFKHQIYHSCSSRTDYV